MRSLFYVALGFAALACSTVVAEPSNPDDSPLLSKVSPDSAAKRSLRFAGQQVVQSGRGNGNGGVWKAPVASINKIINRPDIDVKRYIEAAKKAAGK
ncbi:hypothetical protein PHYSODRAFT_536084 [Phytophthora sojae]|uniref:RxLR effector protein n=1 Tax=Phytophthora sojae (strain P6497) TaxID=1094619 RepID=G5AIS7_PHYSP|nr:hypothetical protein PHYSODRAFT_529641 [Phytophthora sojae]XP_009537770.1 hypothetical protein PHYSODRAFT_530874 [Phytophthora sojae]XP_009539978.1 hypothetical protein PHYSODRAFT_536084 [Phytophthora sojae]EGZ04603.1 hypothetical protein PHYSODRAFT_536084 [Phytophthora sojae]EGZ07001.1 hypothetical protein PHYSODRAFT_529641 [Phytophthora sojae]EGZ07006.1 hypothetical protein PHYSODRAFT_530874 [Phytophthora sojae]|eukprot:XP_009537765.1 hypothetical protein PHYSODRAFT_529641 [Phytophthora sojae]